MVKLEFATHEHEVFRAIEALVAGKTRATRGSIYENSLALCFEELTGSL